MVKVADVVLTASQSHRHPWWSQGERERRHRRGSRRRQICLVTTVLPSAPWICFIAELSYGRKGQNVTGKGDTFHRCPAARSVSPPRTAAVLAVGSRRRAFAFLLRLQLDHRSFWPLSEMPPGQLGIAAVPFCSYCRIELSGLPIAIKAVSAIAEVSRPTIEAAVGFGRRGMVLVTPLVYGFNFRALPF
ncbi:uncharacterized protein LOC107635491 isoform X2 [Arachis ipaensis]|uniref:uncharacterized protein LOC107635491 isoform X2 n=1 Tax=Arachis ipaensis TaxID=130454 RepID=UPI000A2B332C|nr:uncharacterized protein LOC107635491 isoform X2 [Arachis ipaensis]